MQTLEKILREIEKESYSTNTDYGHSVVVNMDSVAKIIRSHKEDKWRSMRKEVEQMQALERILCEIDDLIVHSAWPNMNLVEKEKVEGIIRSHMEDDERHVTDGKQVWIEDVAGGRFAYLPKGDEPVSNPCKLEDGWIPVEMEDDEWTSETALPEENQSVWITIEWAGGERESREALFKEQSFWSAKHITCNRITKAWMPRFVPAPYQPKEEKRWE